MKQMERYDKCDVKRYIIPFLFLLAASAAKADYPLFWQRYTADPSGIEYNGRLYLFCSHDTYDPEQGYGYFMHDITCISTDDLKNWTDHGEVFSIRDAKWGPRLTWAPCVIQRDGKFYLYYGNGDQGIGVAVSDTPTGPYKDENDGPMIDFDTPGVLARDGNGKLIKNQAGVPGALKGSENWGMWCFDPCVWIDDDGQAYMYFGGAHPLNSRIIRLKDNLTEVDGQAVCPNTPGFFEASFMHKYGGKYYYSYAGHGFNIPANIEYVASDRPMDGFSSPGVVLPNPPANDGYNNHHSIFTFRGEWYIAYHNRQVAYEKGVTDQRAREYMRSVCLDRLYHNEDGTIQTVTITRDGLPQLKPVCPYRRNEAETMAKGWNIDTENVEGEAGNRFVHPVGENAYLKIRGVDFGSKGASLFRANVSCDGAGEGVIELRLEGTDGVLIGELPISSTGGLNTWRTLETTVSAYSGTYDLYLVFRTPAKEHLRIDYWEFSN